MFEVLPVVNCADLTCVRERLNQIVEFGGDWVHIDVADGKFASPKNWSNPKELKTDLNVEVHLMVEKPEEVIDDWIAAGVKRVVVHFETLDGPEGKNFYYIVDKCSEASVEVMVAISPRTSAEELLPYLNLVYAVQCLAVSPGPSGQRFNTQTLEKIRFLRERSPDLIIEVDGGINIETAKLVRRAGADMVTSAAYIFGSDNPIEAYNDLLSTDETLREEES
jgi:ribulose-phosphate 3-epimerase